MVERMMISHWRQMYWRSLSIVVWLSYKVDQLIWAILHWSCVVESEVPSKNNLVWFGVWSGSGVVSWRSSSTSSVVVVVGWLLLLSSLMTLGWRWLVPSAPPPPLGWWWWWWQVGVIDVIWWWVGCRHVINVGVIVVVVGLCNGLVFFFLSNQRLDYILSYHR